MTIHTLERKQRLPRKPGEVFPFFESPENLARITPPWLNFRILTPGPIEMKVGTVIDYTIRWLGIPVRWKTLITAHEPPWRFVDEQIKGPYSLWHHTHLFAETDSGTEMTDSVRYALPGGPVGDVAHAMIVRRQLNAIFNYRAEAISRMLEGFDTSGQEAIPTR
jgi:ligand-binding SRPBCC domain-containing protein